VKYDERAYLEYASRSVTFVEEYTSEGREAFLADRRTQSAVLYRLQTLVQALLDLPEEIRATNKDVPWRELRGFRNVVVHDFIGIDLGVIWDTVATHLPVLKPQIAQMLAATNKNAG
jgi:uncharacterized protein with HEPN domain